MNDRQIVIVGPMINLCELGKIIESGQKAGLPAAVRRCVELTLKPILKPVKVSKSKLP